MKAIIENGCLNLFNKDDILIGRIKTELNFQESEIALKDQIFKLIRNGWETVVYEESAEKFHLKTDSLLGNMEILETGYRITGVWGHKWATKLVDEKNKTILKIRNENSFIENGKFEIKIIDETVDDFDILLTFYAHLYGSRMKSNAVGA